jgi:hypothetical protein
VHSDVADMVMADMDHPHIHYDVGHMAAGSTLNTVFILHHSAVGGIKSSCRGNRIETGKNLNPVQKIWVRGDGTLGGGIPPKDA